MQSTKLAPVASASRAGKYLTFLLGKEEFGLEVLQVREIMGVQDITAVPQTPAYLKGVINLRGKVIPVIDLRLKFGLPAADYTPRTCIIVVQLAVRSNSLPMGIIVDEVCEVLSLTAMEIEDSPDFGSSVETSYILGMAKVKDKIKILLDIDRVLNTLETNCLEAAMFERTA